MYKKLTKEIAKEIAGKVKELEAIKENGEDSGTFEVIISTDSIDRSGESIKQEGMSIDNFKKNPIVLWAHDYSTLPIGFATEIIKEKGKTIAKGVFATHAFAQEVRRLYDAKIVRATSVGIMVEEMKGNDITKSELVEFSFVPVPANPEALSLVKASNMDMQEMLTKGFINKLVIAKHETQMAQVDKEWEGTEAVIRTRKHFSKDGSGDKGQMNWDEYAQAFTWRNEVELNDFNSYKLPHHDIIDGEFMTIMRGVINAMSALNGDRGQVNVPDDDREKIWEHLADHYSQFGLEAPELQPLKEETKAVEEEKTDEKEEVKEEKTEETEEKEDENAEKVDEKETETEDKTVEKALTTEEVGAVMAKLQADVDNLIIVASRELQGTAEESKEIKKEEKKDDENLDAVDERLEGDKDTKVEEKGSTDELDAYLDIRKVLRSVDNAINMSLENINKQIKKR